MKKTNDQCIHGNELQNLTIINQTKEQQIYNFGADFWPPYVMIMNNETKNQQG